MTALDEQAANGRMPESAAAARRDADWAHRYAVGLTITDLVIIVWAVVGAQLIRFGVSNADEAAASTRLGIDLNYTFISVILAIAWLVMLAVFKTRDARVVGVGSAEYRLVIRATLWLFGLAAIVFFLFKIDIARAYILVALPLGLVFLLASRWLWRQWLVARSTPNGPVIDRPVRVRSPSALRLAALAQGPRSEAKRTLHLTRTYVRISLCAGTNSAATTAPSPVSSAAASRDCSAQSRRQSSPVCASTRCSPAPR